MEKIKTKAAELLGRFSLSYRVIACLAAAMGVICAVLSLLCPEKTSFYRLSVSPELWLVFSSAIAYKSKKPSDAALFSGIMLIGMHFVAALIKTPFDPNAMSGFLKAVLISAFCVGYAYFFKRALDEGGRLKDWLFALSAAMYILFTLVNFKVFIYSFPFRLLALLICLAAALVFIYESIRDRTSRIVSASVCGVVFLVSALILFSHRYNYKCVVLLDSKKYPITEEWSVKSDDEHISEAKIEGAGEDSVQLSMTIYEAGENTLTFTDENGNEHKMKITYDEKNGVVIDE